MSSVVDTSAASAYQLATRMPRGNGRAAVPSSIGSGMSASSQSTAADSSSSSNNGNSNGGSYLPPPLLLPVSVGERPGLPPPPPLPSPPAVPSPSSPQNGGAAPFQAHLPQGQPSDNVESCYSKADGTRICMFNQHASNNNRQIHNENGLYDYHNDHSSDQAGAMAGKLPGNGVVGAVKAVPTGPPNESAQCPASSTSYAVAATSTTVCEQGTTVFQLKTEQQNSKSQDVHSALGDYSNHFNGTSRNTEDFKSIIRDSSGSGTATTSGHLTSGNKDEDLIQVKGGVWDHQQLNSRKTAGQLNFDKSSPQTGKDSFAVAFTDENKHQVQEHKGDGVYDYREQTADKGGVRVKLDGEPFPDAGKEFEEMFGILGQLGGGEQGERPYGRKRGIVGGKDDMAPPSQKPVWPVSGLDNRTVTTMASVVVVVVAAAAAELSAAAGLPSTAMPRPRRAIIYTPEQAGQAPLMQTPLIGTEGSRHATSTLAMVGYAGLIAFGFAVGLASVRKYRNKQRARVATCFDEEYADAVEMEEGVGKFSAEE